MKNLRYYTVTIVNTKTIYDAGIKTENVLSGNMKSAILFMEAMNPGWICTKIVPTI